MKIHKSSAAIAACAAVALFASGCAGGASESSDGGSKASEGVTTIDFAIHVANPADQEPAFNAVVESFEAENPDIDINLLGKEQSDHIRSIKMQSQSDKLPDMFWILQASAEELNDAGALMDLKPFLDSHPELAKELRPNMVQAFEADGVQYGLPYQPLVTGLFCNKALFDQFGLPLPTTFEDLENAAKVFSENGIVTIAQGARDPYSVWAFLTMMSRYGYFDKIDAILDGKEKFTNDEFISYYEKIDSLRKAGAFPENVTTQSYFQAVESFTSGKAAILDSGTWDVPKIEASDVGENTKFWWGPEFSDGIGNQKISSVVPSAPIVVNAKVANDDAKKQAVERFLEYYYGAEGIQVMVDNQIPPMSNTNPDVDAEAHPVFASVIEQVLDPEYTSQPAQPDLIVSEAIANAMYDSIYGVINGTYTPEQAAAVVQQAIDNEL